MSLKATFDVDVFIGGEALIEHIRCPEQIMIFLSWIYRDLQELQALMLENIYYVMKTEISIHRLLYVSSRNLCNARTFSKF